MRYYSKQQLEELNIYELRFLAREKGVKSPTTKKRDELISSIIALQEGREMPVKRSSQGRPAKSFELVASNLSQKGVKVQEDLSVISVPSRLVFRSAYAPYNQEESKTGEVAGYLAHYSNGYCLLGFSNPMGVEIVAITDEMCLSKYNLSIGDYCFATCRFIAGLDSPIVEDVISVNSESPSYTKRGHFNLLNPNFQRNFILNPGQDKVDNAIFDKIKDIKYGDKALINVENSDSLMPLISNLSKILAQKTEIVTILIGATPEQVDYSQNKFDATVFFSLFTDSYEKQKYLYDLAIQYCKNQVVKGKNLIIVVSSLSNLESAGSGFNVDNCLEPLQIKELFSLARNTKENSSLTIIGAIEKNNISLVTPMLPYIDLQFDCD